MNRKYFSVIFAGLITLNTSFAGVPTLDYTQIAGQIRQISQSIKDYEEYLTQTALSNEDLVEAYKRYDQMLNDYQQVLREAQRLKSTLKGIDLQHFLDQLKNIDMYDPRYSMGDDPHVGDAPWDNAVERNKLINGWGMSDEEWIEMNNNIPYLSNGRGPRLQDWRHTFAINSFR